MDIETVKKVAHLARLQLTNEENAHYCDDLNNIFKMVSKINKIDTSQTQPLFHSLNISQPLREDEVTESDQHEKFQQYAPQNEAGVSYVEAGLYLVPKVIEDSE